MTAPAISAGPESLAPMLALVDGSTARSIAAEDQLLTEVDSLYAKRFAVYYAATQGEQPQEQEEDEAHPLLTAALLAALIALVRRAFASGSQEGLRFGASISSELGFALNPNSITMETKFIDSVIQDFLAGQVDLATKARGTPAQTLTMALAQRARMGVLVAYHGGRNEATEAVFASVASQWTGAVHKLWVARFDFESPPCPLCVRLHGTHVSLDSDFPVPDKEPTPYLGVLSRPPRHPRCRCSLILYLPTKMAGDSGLTPLSMAMYADQVLLASGCEDRNEFVAATVVYVKPYSRVIDGKTQMVDGYYYDIQSGLKVAPQSLPNAKPQKVSHKTASAVSQTSKKAAKAEVSSSGTSKTWPPGTYVVELPDGSTTHTIVHADGSSTSVSGDTTEEANAVQTNQFLSYWDGQGKVTKPGEHNLDMPAEGAAAATMAPGLYTLDHPTFGGFEVYSDGTGKLFSKDFSGKIPITANSVSDIAKGKLGPAKPAEDEAFTPDWKKTHESAKAADEVPDEIAVAEHPSSGPGQTLAAQTLFKVGGHQVAFDEGSQVFRSNASKDTLYVLDPDGVVTKYNPQGSGVQATVVATSSSPAARADLLAKLDNVSADGSAVKNTNPVPGSKPVYLGGLDLTSTQLEDAILALEGSPSPAIASLLGKVGSPLASTDVHAIAAPYKAMFNNKTKPAFLHALHQAYEKTSHPPLEKTGVVAHLEEHHGVSDHQADLGDNDVASIHAAIHAEAGASADHGHDGAGPGIIEIYGTPFTPEMVQGAIDALKGEASTSVKSPLKKADSPLAGSKHLNDFANDFAGTKLHYSKFKPTLIAALQDALAQHQKAAPPAPKPVSVSPAPQVEFGGSYGTKADLIEARAFIDTLDISSFTGDFAKKFHAALEKGPKGNPYLLSVDWVEIADLEAESGYASNAVMNEHIHSALTKAIGDDSVPTASAYAKPPSGPVTFDLPNGASFVLQTQDVSKVLSDIDVAMGKGISQEEFFASSYLTKSEIESIVKAKLGSFYSQEHVLQDLSVILQGKLDDAAFDAEMVKGQSPLPVTEATIDGKKFAKADLYAAIDLLKAEQSTSVKGPIKTAYPELAKTDLKSLAEAHAGTKLHYSKLKAAVIDALQAKADGLADALPDGVAPTPPDKVVTKFGTPAPAAAPASALEADIALAEPAASIPAGTWTHPSTASTWIVNPDGSGKIVKSDGYEHEYSAEVVADALSGSMWTKVSDTSTNPELPNEQIPDSPGVKLSPLKGLLSGLSVSNLTKPELLDAAQSWAADAGYADVAGLHLKTKSKDDLVAWTKAWATGNWDKAYEIEAKGLKYHKARFKHPGSPLNPSNSHGFTKVSMASAIPGETPAGEQVPGSWPEFTAYSWSSDQVDNYLLAAQMQNPTGLHDWYKKQWVISHVSGDKLSTDNMSVMAANNVKLGQHKSEPILPDVEMYPPGMAVPADPSWPALDPSKAAALEWNASQVDKYLSHMGSKTAVKALLAQDLEVKQQLVQLHYVASLSPTTGAFKKPTDAKNQMTAVLEAFEKDSNGNGQVLTAMVLNEALAIKEHTYTRDKVQPHFGGGSQAAMIQVVDEMGTTFIFKEAPKAFRAESEHAMHDLAKLAGLSAADSRLGTFEGMFGQFQVKLDSKSSMTGVPAHTLPLTALSDVMRSHVFDWAVNNDDAHAENFLLSPDGSRAFPIDFGRAFAHFGSGGMQLEPGQLSNWANLYYNRVYDDMINGSISEKDTDALYQKMIQQARKMEAIPDASWSGVLEEAFANRPKYSSTSANNKDELIAQALARKNSLVSDFEAFWDKMYAQLGREKPVQSGISDHVFSGNSDEWHARAQSVGAGGAATFFSGAELEDGHLLAQVVSKPGTGGGGVPTFAGVKVGNYYDPTTGTTVTLHPDGSISGDTQGLDTGEAISLFKDPSISWVWTPLDVKAVSKTVPIGSAKNPPLVNGVKAGEWYDPDNEIYVTIHPDGSVEGIEDVMDPSEFFDLLTGAFSSWEWQSYDPKTAKGVTSALPTASTGEGQELWLSGQLRADADQKLRAWLAAHVTGKVIAGGGAVVDDKTAQLLSKSGLDTVSDAIIQAAKTISHHHKQGDKNYNSQRIANFEAARAKLQEQLKFAKAGSFPTLLPEVDQPKFFQLLHYYLEQANDVDVLREDGGVSYAGQFAPFEFKLTPPPATEPPPNSPSDIKVTLKQSFFEGATHDADGGMVSTGQSVASGAGQVYIATLPDGTQIEYRSWHKNEGIPISQQGALKVRVRQYDGSSGSVEPALAALRQMGLELEGSSEEDMELLYWRHLYGIMIDRSDTSSGKYASVRSHVVSNIPLNGDGSSSLSKEAELAAWRAAWSQLDAAAVTDFVAKRRYLPRFSHPNIVKPQEVGGQPYWMRFDMDPKTVRATGKMPTRISSKSDTMLNMVKSGGFYSTEDRPKILGEWSSGMSSATDQGTGASNFIFLRQNQSSSSYQYYFNPEVLMRTSNYAYNSDKYGRISDRKTSAHFDPKKAASHTGSSNEIMIKHTLTVLDDLEVVGFHDSKSRQEAIAFLHKHGIYSIRGLPVENRMVLLKDITEAIAKVNAHRKKWDPDAEELVA